MLSPRYIGNMQAQSLLIKKVVYTMDLFLFILIFARFLVVLTSGLHRRYPVTLLIISKFTDGKSRVSALPKINIAIICQLECCIIKQTTPSIRLIARRIPTMLSCTESSHLVYSSPLIIHIMLYIRIISMI